MARPIVGRRVVRLMGQAFVVVAPKLSTFDIWGVWSEISPTSDIDKGCSWAWVAPKKIVRIHVCFGVSTKSVVNACPG